MEVNIGEELQKECKPGDYVTLDVGSGVKKSGRVVELRAGLIVLEQIDTYWRKGPDGKFVPDMSTTTAYVPYEEVCYFDKWD